nr:pro135=cell-wall-bound proteinase [Lactobacillus paracasei, subsp. paracasei, NCDO 151, Peptide Partial, 8 aa] [Lacticaseibacillus paracasei]
AKANSMAN